MNRGRKLGKMEPCCWASLDENAWRDDERSGHRPRASVISTLHRRKAKGGGFCCCDYYDYNTGDVGSCDEGGGWPMCFPALPALPPSLEG